MRLDGRPAFLPSNAMIIPLDLKHQAILLRTQSEPCGATTFWCLWTKRAVFPALPGRKSLKSEIFARDLPKMRRVRSTRTKNLWRHTVHTAFAIVRDFCLGSAETAARSVREKEKLVASHGSPCVRKSRWIPSVQVCWRFALC